MQNKSKVLRGMAIVMFLFAALMLFLGIHDVVNYHQTMSRAVTVMATVEDTLSAEYSYHQNLAGSGDYHSDSVTKTVNSLSSIVSYTYQGVPYRVPCDYIYSEEPVELLIDSDHPDKVLFTRKPGKLLFILAGTCFLLGVVALAGTVVTKRIFGKKHRQ